MGKRWGEKCKEKCKTEFLDCVFTAFGAECDQTKWGDSYSNWQDEIFFSFLNDEAKAGTSCEGKV